MRKLILCLLLIFSLCACGNKTEAIPETKNLSFCVATVSQNTEYILSATTNQNSQLHLTVENPENIANLKMFFCGDTVKINYLDLEKEIPLVSLHPDSVFRILYEGILKASETENLSIEDDKYFIPFSVETEDYFIYFGQSGLPLEIKAKDNETRILIKDAAILN